MPLTTVADFGLLFDALPTPYLAIAPDLTLVAANAAAASWLGCAAAQLLEQPAATALPLRGGLSWPALLAELRTAPAPRTVPVLAPDAALRTLTLRPVPAPEGGLAYLLAQPAAAGPAQESFRFLSEFIPQLVWTTDAVGRPEYFNQRWLDYTGHLAPAPDWITALHPDDQGPIGYRWARALATDAPLHVEARLLGHYEHCRWFLIQAQPLRDASGRVTHWLGTCTDIDDARLAQQRLQAKDQQLLQLLGQLPAYVATVFGTEHLVAFTTPNFQELPGGLPRVGWPLGQSLPADVAPLVVPLLDEAYHTGRAVRVQALPIAWPAPAPTRYYDFTLQPLLAERGQSHGVLLFAYDVTDQVLARRRHERLSAAVRRHNAHIRTLTEALPLISFSLAPSGRLVYVSPQWAAYVGTEAATARAADWHTYLHPDDVPALVSSFARARRERRPWTAQLRLRHHGGELRWHLLRALPVFDEAGRLSRWFGSLTDMHEQLELQAELRRSEAEFRFLADSIPQLVWTLAPDGAVEFLNQGWLEYTNSSVDEVRRAGWAALVPAAEREQARQVLAENVRLGRYHEHENRLRRATDGQYRWYLHRARPMRDAEGRIVRWFGTSTDIDDQKRFQYELEERNAELLRINQDLDNFVYTASHDLRQPIDNMAGIFQELARSARYDDPDAPALMAMFEHSLDQIYTTIKDLAALVQVQKQNLFNAPEEVRLERLTQEVLHSIGEQIRAADAVVETDFAAVPAVEFVRPNLQSVLYNLLSNAVKYASPERRPHIRVWTEPGPAGQVLLAVQDNGLGIDLDRYGNELFQLFRRFHDHVPGSGTGLYLVQRLVQAHGGRIEVESAVGLGTTFRMQLPGAVAAVEG